MQDVDQEIMAILRFYNEEILKVMKLPEKDRLVKRARLLAQMLGEMESISVFSGVSSCHVDVLTASATEKYRLSTAKPSGPLQAAVPSVQIEIEWPDPRVPD